MLQITLDIFSGRENPHAYVEGADARAILLELARNRSIVTTVESGYQGLGFRGVIIELTDDETATRYALPSVFKIAGGSSPNEAKAQEIAERLIRVAANAGSRDGVAFSPNFESEVLEMLAAIPAHEYHGETDSHVRPAPPLPAGTCYIELGAFNPGFWNDPNYIGRNNCYNYASNKRTNTFAQPGRGSGHMYTSLLCPAVAPAAMSDGLHHRFDCLPDSEKPRWLVALVVAPGRDYHWYRKQKEGFWGHKPGGTPARNVDNNGALVTNPETCARQPYTDFCGYFYVPRSQKIS
jgi:hypothetical protein